ncbi:polysaccharide pyruvyl transferase family protein [Mycobacterium conspicuum]|uniref:Polysaccharide pyruvyl transferase n=1 Tax=Mycobacterium conspicuum TaxID=44010 RepID=A0A1X1TDL7_9MYCO|nr:polysaccharide pyruvyl transferase family protein [Mycobacterium conspicuum]ORV42588.1 polysaccharide pyruvyl transferase [Mycobacterium conspicuum]BBZ39143.1 polysaccharide pyruvyl transferase [Mycobacterium conspicuum]
MTSAADALVAYVGWHGMGNLGDDAIYDAVRGQLPGATFLDLPRFTHERLRAFATGQSRRLRRSTQVVGGGTVVGTEYFRGLISRGLALTGNNGSYAIGVGVDDPVFDRRTNASAKDELKHWLPILSKFHTVSVRGPRSAELLSDAGLNVQVSGDPALLLPRPDARPEDGLIGLNLGFGDDDLWGQDPTRVADEMSSAIRQLSSQGHRFVGILMNTADKRWTERALDGIPADIVRPADANAAARELARCSVAVVSRLHAGILAALSDTPVVSLEYLPKCRDFALSIDDERSLIRTDRLTSAAVVDHVASALADSATIRVKTHAAVATLRQRLQAEYAALGRHLGLAGG